MTGKRAGWEHLGKLSSVLQDFRHLYVLGEAESDSTALADWRVEIRQFFMELLASGRSAAAEDAEDQAPLWVHFHFDAFCSVLCHSCCDWSSSEAFGCGLMSEVSERLLEVQSQFPVSASAIVHVLLHQLATLRPGKETKGQYGALAAALQQVLEACPAMPAAAVKASVDHCLRSPPPGATWSLSSTSLFVRGVLSLVTQSPRALGSAVIPLLVRFVSEERCSMSESGASPGFDSLAEPEEGAQQTRPCVSCLAADAHYDISHDAAAKAQQMARCEAQEKRDLVLEGLLRWVVDAHFRRCSRLLQTSLHRAVCDGVQQELGAAAAKVTEAFVLSPRGFPLACRLLLAFAGGLAGDGGVEIAAFLQDRCRDELRRFLMPTRVTASSMATRVVGRPTCAVLGEQELPVLRGYVGHLCLCRHLGDNLVRAHLMWLTQQTLATFRLVESRETNETPASSDDGRNNRKETSRALQHLCYAIAELLTRQKRGRGNPIEYIWENTGKLLEIIFDSDVRPLATLPRPLAAAAVRVLQGAGHLQLTRLDVLLGPDPRRRLSQQKSRQTEGGGAHVKRSVDEDTPVLTASETSFADKTDFRSARVAFQKSWELVEAGVDIRLPSIRYRVQFEDFSDHCSSDTDGFVSDEEREYGNSNFPQVENGWESVPDEIALRVFSFLTPKRVCRLACVERAWRKLLGVPRVWKPLFKARWPLRSVDTVEDFDVVLCELLETPADSGNRPKRKRATLARASRVFDWDLLEDSNTTGPGRDWMALYRDRHKAELSARGRSAAKTNFAWRVCPFLGCVVSLKSEFAVKRHVKTHKKPPPRRREDPKKSPAARKRKGSATPTGDARRTS